MTDEEKKAIEILNKFIKANDEFICQECGFNQQDEEKSLKILLNLIEKQSKEIEELKEKNFELEYLDTGKILENKIKAKIEEVEQWELYNMKIPRLSTLDERLGAKIGIKYVLQSLLEKE